jgi:signal transduction histidine kinase
MKTTVFAFVVTLMFVDPAWAVSLAATRRPTQAVLNAPISIPVVISGRQSGSVMVNKGTLVTIAHVRHDRLQINFQGSQAWVKRTDTDFDQRLAAFKQTKQTAQAQVQQAQSAQNAVAQEQRTKAAADFHDQHGNYTNPLDKGAYDQNRSVVDYYDWLGRRYHIGVFGQRIYQ